MGEAAYEEVEHLWIEMADGVRLAARAWVPRERPAPACIEYIPYGKRWGTRERDESLHGPLAARGIGCIRVDVRGTADSEGRLEDEYSEAELDDGCAVVEWAARQPWCDGRVFMLGKSWGGFNVLQIAARRPPSLSGIVSVYASDDRFGNDAHYMGGCLLNENQVWGSMLFALAAEPPSPILIGEGWRERWRSRLAEIEPFIPRWLEHQVEDEYWRRGSVRHDYGSIACPVLLVAGWNDPYRDGALRLARSLVAETTLVVGPWAHHYPHEPGVGPAIDFPSLVADWIEGKRRGARLVWLADGLGEEAFRSIDDADLNRDEGARWSFGDPSRFASAADAESRVIEVASPLTVGARSGAWCPFGPSSVAREQSEDDARSVIVETAPLDGAVTLFGFPRVELRVNGEAGALLVVRLLEVDRAGSSRRIAYGATKIVESGWHEVAIVLTATGHRFAAGSRLRVALSTSYWPTFWPGRGNANDPLMVDLAGSAIMLPMLDERRQTVSLPTTGLTMAEDGDDAPVKQTIRQIGRVQQIVRESGFDDGDVELDRYADIGVSVGFASRRTYRIDEDDPLSARCHVTTDARFLGESFNLRVVTSTRLRGDCDEFHLRTRLEAFEDGRRFMVRRWLNRIPRRW